MEHTFEQLTGMDFIGAEKAMSWAEQRKKFENESYEDLRQRVLHLLLARKRQGATELLVQKIESENYLYTTKNDIKSEMWIYQEGIYLPQGKCYVREFCRMILEASYTPQLANDVIAKIETDTYIEQEKFFQNQYIDEVPVQNGILDVLGKKLTAYDPKKIFFHKLPVNYDPEAKCPKITQHFEDVLRDKEDKKVMFELFGYSLYKENKFEKAFMFIGDGRNGKSKTLELMKNFLGVSNCSSIPLHMLNENSYEVSELFGKMVNLAGDLSSSCLKETGVLKMLAGRDLISAKRKFLRNINFVNYSKLIFSCNELPKVFDNSLGFWSKWILLEFPFEFVSEGEYKQTPTKNKKVRNEDIVQEISTPEELSGLLNEALDGLKRLLSNRNFSYTRGTQEVKDLWIRRSNSFTAFCMDFIKEDAEDSITKKDLRKLYHLYCKYHKLRGSSDVEIKITLENLYGVFDKQDSNYERIWEGITFKTPTGTTGFSDLYREYQLTLSSEKGVVPVKDDILTPQLTIGEQENEEI